MKKLLKNRKSITNWLDKYGVENYKLVKDAQYGFVVNINGNVYLGHKNLTILPVKFGVVSGYFYCSLIS